ncbi:GNAT family N-acetyltransferase [Methanoculleus taiwanensis]|uniref:GNAT family N-acetyltransferase n=1 Tax=Methanoculleus taiwanensis TaxID=1550565 RepID=UPI000FFE4201
MFERVLVPTDFSEYSMRTVECLGQIPGVREVMLLHALDAESASMRTWLSGQTFETPAEHAERRLAIQSERVEELGLEPIVILDIVRDGDIAGAVVSRAAGEQIPLIVIGARGKGIIQGYFLGSVSSDVLRRSTVDILITRYRDAAPEACRTNIFSRVLCPVDFSRPSRMVIDFVGRIEDIPELILVHVIRSAETKEELVAGIEEAERKLSGLAAELAREGLSVRTIVRFGNPSQEITDLAEEEDASLILISRYGEQDYFRDIPLGTTVADVAKRARRPVLVKYPVLSLAVEARELAPEEFPKAEAIWKGYHQQKANKETDRIFGVFLDGNLVSLARCRRHPDGREVDGVFTPEEFRGRGYAKKAVEALVSACGNDVLYMHSTNDLVSFYASFGFALISERELPPTIRERYAFAGGNMEGSNVSPMKRMP